MGKLTERKAPLYIRQRLIKDHFFNHGHLIEQPLRNIVYLCVHKGDDQDMPGSRDAEDSRNKNILIKSDVVFQKNVSLYFVYLDCNRLGKQNMSGTPCM